MTTTSPAPDRRLAPSRLEEALDRAVAMHAEAATLCDQGKPRVAEKRARAALLRPERLEGRHHPDVANTLLVLGRALEMSDQWKSGLRCYERAHAIMRRYTRLSAEEMRRLTVKVERALCCALRALGSYERAALHGRRAVAGARRFLGPRDLDLAGALNDLGMVRKYQGRLAEAPPLYREALKILRLANLDDGADAASVYHNLGGIEHARGRYGRAEAPARKAVELRRRAYDATHPAVAADLAALAAILQRRGKMDESASLYRKALLIFRRAFGGNSYEVGVNIAGLADISQARGDLRTAERLYERSLAIHQALLGSRHIEVAITLNNLAQVIYDRGQVVAARRMARRALASFRASVGSRHPSTTACAKNVAALRYKKVDRSCDCWSRPEAK